MFPWASAALERQKQKKQKKQNISVWDVENIFNWRFYACDFGYKHFLNEKCECARKYKTFWILFKEKLKEFWYKIERNSDITAEMQDKYKFLVLNLK